MIKPLFQRIVVAYNGSQSSLHAVMYAILMAKQFKCHIKVVYVVDTVTIRQLTMSKFMVKDEGEQIEGGLTTDGDRNLTYAVKLAAGKGIKIDAELRKGAVWSEIISAADEFKADLILLGGTADSAPFVNRHDVISRQNGEIIGSAHCSVMLVRQPQIEQLFKIA
ncbi:MAG: universal stress protein [Treponema sp.]|nr:universal stress protein [Treponema sp.]